MTVPGCAEGPASAQPPRVACAAALRVLDGVLALAVERTARLLGPASLLDPWRGLHLGLDDVKGLLESPPNAALLAGATEGANVCQLLAAAARRVPAIEHFATSVRLADVDLATVLIVLAPDVDLRYERIYAYLQDDITRKRPSLDLIAALLASTVEERLNLCARFHADTPLSRFDVVATQVGLEMPAIARGWRLEEPWLRFFLGEEPSDSELGHRVRFVVPTRVEITELGASTDTELLHGFVRTQSRVRLMLQGPHGAGKFRLAQGMAYARRQKLLLLDVRDCESVFALRKTLRRADRVAALASSILYVHGITHLEQRDPQMLRTLVEGLAEGSASFVVSCTQALPPLHVAALELVRISLAMPDAPRRSDIWSRALALRNVSCPGRDIETTAACFALSASQIEQAVMEVARHGSAVTARELAAAARAQSGGELARLAQRITPRADLDTLIVPADVRAQMREICSRMRCRDLVRNGWSNGSVHARSLGVTALFVGPSGTGKTLSAEAIARELGLDLFRIDLAGIVSKYIGETEKNLERVFAAAEHANAVLFFDEADALFGKRSEVKDAHDRYANIEVAYLLQKMEQFDGLAVLATNLKQNLDEAFARRLTFTVNFPFPEIPERRRLWESLWPALAPRAADVDLEWFANEFPLSGGNIRNTILAAAHLAASNGQLITRDHLLHATRREFQKLGKNLALPADRRSAG